jgi:hypothetical protein
MTLGVYSIEGLIIMESNTAVIKRGNIEDEQTGEAYEVFEFKTVSGKTRQVSIPRANSRNACHIYKELLRLNADLPLFEGQGLNEVQRAIDTEVAPQLVYARAFGWRRQFKGFVLASAFIGERGGKRGVLPPLWASDQELPGFRRKGTLAQWSKAVAAPAMVSDRLVLVLAACFAAPLLHVVSRGNFGLNLFEWAPEDRKVVVSVAGSVLGIDYLPRLAAAADHTAPSLEYARAFNDLVLIVGGGEEFGLATDYRRWRQGIKVLSLGRRKPKPKSPALAWRGTFLTMPKYSNEYFATSRGEVRTSDERAGWIDIAPGGGVLFGSSASDARQRLLKREQLLAACADQHGTPMRAYIRFLIARRATLKRAIQKPSEAFVALTADQGVPTRHRMITNNFALLYAAGCLAIKAGILPWKRQHLRQALQRQLIAAIAHLRSYHITPGMIRRILRRRLRSSMVVHPPRNRASGPSARHAGPMARCSDRSCSKRRNH